LSKRFSQDKELTKKRRFVLRKIIFNYKINNLFWLNYIKWIWKQHLSTVI